MSDYTPTTEEVRKRSRMVRAGKLYFKELRITDAEFDRWLAEVKAQERERIIKLLEIEISELEGHDGTCDCKTRADELRVTITLIKGEEQ